MNLKWLQNNAKKDNFSFAKYLCLVGVADFNLKRLNKNNQVPVFESEASLDILNSYASDDFYAILKDGADINLPSSIDSLEIAIGRIPAKTSAEADTMVNKIIQYSLNSSKGSWQNQITWIADDGDYNLHLQDAESIIEGLQKNNANWSHKKLYLDLYPANNAAGGLSYPLVVNEITQNVNNGSLVLNYTGHGNYLRLAEEAVINNESIKSWNNAGRLPLMITASCDFAPYDQPQLNPIGFNTLMQNRNGIIALVAANRLVFAYSNKQINEQFIQALLVSDKNGQYHSIGKALQIAKNTKWSMQGDRLNAFKFNLLGDPALQLAIPKNKIQHIIKDTLNAGVLATFNGQIMKDQKETNRKISYEDISADLQHSPDMIYHIDDDSLTTEEIIKKFLLKLKDSMGEKAITEQEVKLGQALYDIFENYNDIFLDTSNNKFNKNVILFELREMTNLSTKEIRTSIKRYKKVYFQLVQELLK